ncbi:acyltransferase family protein [uncultured Amaricoccus sp.]|uniref:acyltransferase family protein n=1 Tax=uncultured Amaricoccus sp. TaxID=339341 RepID=UPI00260A7511|nr:acyltransferase family protein [uncultured Amaricoccus sp.]
MKYRSEIDGLRAVAVVPVILFHAGFERFSGGFVGVDVFFVLSGYLITTILLAEIAEGRFSLIRFYERRARRILPALYFVMLVTLPFAFRLMLPDEFASFAQALISVLFFVSNVYFWQTTDYFSRAAEESPLLHTWSLGVEEQYYMLFPLGLLLLWRLGPRGALAGLIAGSLASLALAEYGVHRWPVPTFFLLPTRAWELGLGSLAAFYLTRRGLARIPARFGGGAAALGLAMILASVALFDAETPFPSLYALLPTVGTVLVVLYADPGALAGRLLSWRPVVFVGLISYSAYLWHQPLFAFARITEFRQPGDGLMLGLSLLALLLAALTWRYVERPFRDRTAISARGILGYGLASSAGLLLLAGVAPWLAASPTRYPPEQRQFTIPLADHADYVERGYNRLTQADFVDDGRRRLLIIGDSFSQDFYNMIAETGGFPGYQIVTRRFLSTCQIYLGPEDVTPLLGAEAANCARQVQAADLVPLAREADVVVFAFSWRPWSGARVAETIANFGFRDDQTVLVIGRKSFGYFNARSFLGMDPAARLALRNGPRPEHAATNEIMRRLVAPEMFVDTQALVCGAAPDCPLFAPDGGMISFDGNHLTRAGARYLGTLLFRDPRLAPFAPRTGAAL